MSQEFSVIGKRTPRINGIPLVRGTAKFSNDVSLPGMLYGRILKSPYAHAKITAIDTSKATALPGVKAVITYKDVPAVQMSLATNPPYRPIDQYILEDEVRYVGEEVAAVAATDPFIAEDALDLIQVTYQQLPFVLTTDDALKSNAPLVHATETSNLITSLSGTRAGGVGDPDAALAASDHTFEKDASTPRQPVAPIGPQTVVFDWPPGGKLTVYDTSQGTYCTKTALCYVLGLPESQINVIDHYMGGGFGMPNAYRFHPLGAILAQKTQRPVKIEPGKKYQFGGSPKMRHPAKAHSKLGINNDGTLQALEVDSTWDKGAYTCGGNVAPVGATGVTTVYQLPGKFAYKVAYTNCPPSGAFRGYGCPQGHFFTETLVNKAAEELGIDPVTIRSKSVMHTGYMGAVACGLGDCLTQGAAKFGWNWKPFKSKTDTGVVRSGIGCVVGAHTTGGTTGNQSATVVMNVDGTATVLTSVVEIGTGVVTNMAMIAAEELALRPEHVAVEWGNSSLPEAQTQSATKTTHTLGRAVQLAANQVKQTLFGVAATMLNVTADKLSAKDEVIFVTEDPTKKVTMADVCLIAPRSVVGSAVRPVPPSTSVSNVWYANFAEVKVDTETGDVDLVRMVLAHDVGRAINLNTLENQIEGGAMQALSWAMASEHVIDGPTGTPLTRNYLDYGLYSLGEAPNLDVVLVESNDPFGPFGAKGIGEPAHNAPAAAVASAIYNAIGVWLDPPFTSANVLHALGKV
jgi:xanthine dehydrogenase molybdenum-binding subunit